MNPIAMLLYPVAKKFLVQFLRKEASKSSNTLDDKLVAAVEVSLEGKDYNDVLESVKKEAERAKEKVDAVKAVVKKARKSRK